MSTDKMHAGEIAIDMALVQALLRAQFPDWADLPLEQVRSAGTDHSLYRLGTDRVVRLPRIAWAAGQGVKEQHWLPYLAPHLPLAVPEPLGYGTPDEGYPWHWSIYRWLDGENVALNRIADKHQLATDIARFILAMQYIDASEGPLAGEHNFGRGVPSSERDAAVRVALGELRGMIDVAAAIAVWEDTLRAPVWTKAPVWVHGDLQSGNLLAGDGILSAVIDFGGLGVGDPAVDLIVAWNLLDADSRETFRAAVAVDEATWIRGRGWALSIALIALPYYKNSNPTLAEMSRYTIREVLDDYAAVAKKRVP